MTTYTRIFSNNAKTTLTSPITSTDSSLIVSDASKFPVPGNNQYFLATLDTGLTNEIVEVHGVTGNTFTGCVRGAESTIAQSFLTGTRIENRVTAGTLSSFARISDIPYDSPSFIGVPVVPTAPEGTASEQIANTAFVAGAVADGLSGVSGQFKDAPGLDFTANTTITAGQVDGWGRLHGVGLIVTLPALASVRRGSTFTILGGTYGGTLRGSFSENITDNLSNSANTLHVNIGECITVVNNKGVDWSVIVNDKKTAVTQTPGDNTTNIATTAFVIGQASSSNPSQASTAAAGTSTSYSRADHVHPATAPTAASSDNSTAIATTAFVSGTAKSFTKAQRGAVVALTSSTGSIAVNLSLANNYSHTLTENTTLAAPSNAVEGQSGYLYLTQNASSAKTLAYNTFWKFPGGSIPTLTTTLSAVDVFVYSVDPGGTSATCQLLKDRK